MEPRVHLDRVDVPRRCLGEASHLMTRHFLSTRSLHHGRQAGREHQLDPPAGQLGGGGVAQGGLDLSPSVW